MAAVLHRTVTIYAVPAALQLDINQLKWCVVFTFSMSCSQNIPELLQLRINLFNFAIKSKCLSNLTVSNSGTWTSKNAQEFQDVYLSVSCCWGVAGVF